MAIKKQKSFPPPDLRPLHEQYPEIKPLVMKLADHVCQEINRTPMAICPRMVHVRQGILEAVIQILESRV